MAIWRQSPFLPRPLVNWRAINAVTEWLVLILQRRGVVRTQYTQPTLYKTILEF